MENHQDIKEKVALITGASRRVGAVIARTLHDQGMNVVLHYLSSHKEAEFLRDQLNNIRPDSAISLACNLHDIPALAQLIEQSIQPWGRLDALINNASTFYPTPVGAITEEHWDNLIGSNLKAPLFLAQNAASSLKKSHGCIVNIADIHAERPLKDYTVYSVAKAGLIMLTKSLARELGPEIRVNAVAPGAILWPEKALEENVKQRIIAATALKRQGEPDDIARAILFLIRDADYISGTTITVDGGRTLSG